VRVGPAITPFPAALRSGCVPAEPYPQGDAQHLNTTTGLPQNLWVKRELATASVDWMVKAAAEAMDNPAQAPTIYFSE
jgi:hypothetical protein